MRNILIFWTRGEVEKRGGGKERRRKREEEEKRGVQERNKIAVFYIGTSI
jgi:hypothetical protein